MWAGSGSPPAYIGVVTFLRAVRNLTAAVLGFLVSTDAGLTLLGAVLVAAGVWLIAGIGGALVTLGVASLAFAVFSRNGSPAPPKKD